VTDAVVREENDRQSPRPLGEIDILWLNGGLGCDGESVAMTGATQPSVEDLVMGAIPGLPKVRLHNPFLAYENGDEFLNLFRRAAEGSLEPFILVVEGSIPDEGNKSEGYWAAFGADALTGQPITTSEWIDRLAPKALVVLAVGTCATYGGIHAMAGNPTGCDGSTRLPGLELEVQGRHSDRLRARAARSSPTTLRDHPLPALSGDRPGADDPARRGAAPTWLFGQSPCTRGATAPAITSRVTSHHEYGSPKCIVKLGCWGPGRQVQRAQTRLDVNGIGGCPNVGGICIGCTMPGFPDKFMPFMDEPPGSLLSSHAVMTYGRAIHALRRFTQDSLNKEPEWRRRKY
jgi:hydrogenase small subunit